MAASANLAFTLATGASGAAVSYAVSEPLMQVFNGTGLVMALMGALGGATFALVDRAKLRDGVRQAILGGLLAFGLGVIAPVLLGRIIGAEFTGQAATVQGLGAVAYLVGFAQERVASWLLVMRNDRDNE